MSSSSDAVVYKGILEGHKGWVTSISAPSVETNAKYIISSSRDKRVMLWELSDIKANKGGTNIGFAKRAFTGHSSVVQDVVMSSDANFALSGSWDKELRLWDLSQGRTVRRFTGHSKEVFSVAFSFDNRQIVSAGRDKTIKLWNTLAKCKYTLADDQHTDWICCVRFSPSTSNQQNNQLVVSASWDKVVKVWNLQTCHLKTDLVGHTCTLNAVTISPDGSLCASGGKDGTAMLWDVNEGKHLYSLDACSTINGLCFSPCNYWLCAATDKAVMIWDLENKNVLAELCPTAPPKNGGPWCTCLCWSGDGKTLFAGSCDGNIYVYETN